MSRNRLGVCEVCVAANAKYTCPACDVKTCSVECVQNHKEALPCTGVRNRVKYKSILKFSDLDLQNDYFLLEELGKFTGTCAKVRRKLQKNIGLKWYKLRGAAFKRGIHLQILPPNFSKHKTNTTNHDWKKNTISWRVEWIFAQGNNIRLVNHKVSETSLIKSILGKNLNPLELSKSLKDNLEPYIKAGIEHVSVLIKVEKVQGDKFLLIDKSLSLCEALQGKIVIEFPVFLAVLTSELGKYNLVSPDEVLCEVKKNGFQLIQKNSMRFFSENISGSEDSS